MSWRGLLCKHAVKKLQRPNGKFLSPYSDLCRSTSTITVPASPLIQFSEDRYGSSTLRVPKCPKPISSFTRYVHSSRVTRLGKSGGDPKVDLEEGDDGTMSEFLSRFVWIMRKKLVEAFPGSDKQTIDGMLLIIVSKVASELEKGGVEQILGTAVTPQDFSEDLWKTVWEVSNMVLDDMKKERKKEKMKKFLQCDAVKEMCRFAGEVGIRGDMLRELRFKWAREEMEEHEFYEGLERLRKEEQAQEKEEEETGSKEMESNVVDVGEKEPKVVTLPKRRGKIRFKIYGLDLSDPKWAEVADRIHEAEEVIWPQEPKPIFGKSKLVTEKIMSLNEEDDPSGLLAEWVELLQPSRVDWITLLDRLEEKSTNLYLKVADITLNEESFQTNIRDYLKLIDIYARENRLGDAERIIKKMNENGILPDPLIVSASIHMYCKAGNIERAREAFNSLRIQGFQPDFKAYNSLIMACVRAGEPKMAETFMREMETLDIKPTEEMYMALLRSFAEQGSDEGAERMSRTMQFAGFQPTMESCALLVDVYGRKGQPDQARSKFDYMIKLGYKPDDRCTASMIAAYESKNLLDKALNLLLELEKDGLEPGVATYSVLVDWLGKLQLVDEAEQLVGKIAQQGEAPPLKVQVSLCDMYARAGVEKKALQALGVLEARKNELGQHEFERIIDGLRHGGFKQEAQRIHGIMVEQRFTASTQGKVPPRGPQGPQTPGFKLSSMR